MASISLVRLMTWAAFKTNKPKPEQTLSMEFAGNLRGLTLDGRLNAVWTHVPNEIGWNNNRVAQMIYAAAKAMGMIVGSPDYVFLGKDRSLALEAKSDVGSQSPAQKDFQAWCESQKVPYHVFRSVDEGIAILEEQGFIERPAR